MNKVYVCPLCLKKQGCEGPDGFIHFCQSCMWRQDCELEKKKEIQEEGKISDCDSCRAAWVS